MKTPMPEPKGKRRKYYVAAGEDDFDPSDFEYYWIEAQLRAAMVAAYREGVEDAIQAAYTYADNLRWNEDLKTLIADLKETP